MRMSSSHLRSGVLAAGLTGVLVMTGCSAGSSSGGGGDAPSIAAGTTGGDWALNFTGGTKGAADSTKTPITIGFVNGDTIFPDTAPTVAAAVDYVNTELGGVGGHKLALQSCSVNSDDDGRKCGTEMANSAVSMVVVGTLALGSGTFFGTLAGKKPTLVGLAINPADRNTANTYNFLDSAVSVTATITYASTLVPAGSKVLAIGIDSPSGRDNLDNFIVPKLKAGGATVTTVPLARDATAPQIATSLTAAGAADADMIVNNASPGTCAATYDALQQVPNKAKFVDTGSCLSATMTSHLKDLGVTGAFPDGWYFGTTPFLALLPTDKGGVNSYLQVMRDKAPQVKNYYSSFTAYSFAALIDAVAILNPIANNLSSDAIVSAIKGFSKVPMLNTAKPKCGFAGATYAGSCQDTSGVYQYKNGTMTSIQSGSTDNPITVSTLPGS